MDISQVARRSGVPASTLRYYEKQGLLVSLGREGAKRVFVGTVIEQLGLIALGQAAGLSLDEIRLMLTPGGALTIDRSLLSRKAGEIDATIKQLRAVSRGLRHAAKCPAPSHAECPTFRRLLSEAASGALPKASAPLAPTTKRLATSVSARHRVSIRPPRQRRA
ncbi:MAG: MerR family transcriptional regulator [Xanthomonadaceae bacterium]|nr:MerR family transcriptional regulator [Xanthomonadaceae bacterium]